MAAGVGMSTLVASIPEANRWKLDKEIDYERKGSIGGVVPYHLALIAKIMTKWEEDIAIHLGLSQSDQDDILSKNHGRPVLQRQEALRTWKQRQGSQGTYRALMEIFVHAGRIDCAEKIVDILKEGADTSLPGASGSTSVTPTVVFSRLSGNASTVANGVEHRGEAVQSDKPDTDTSGGGFSVSMTPQLLAQWLLSQYGEDFKHEVNKLKDGLINGELLLDLPSDKDLLDGLNLIPAFKKLILKKAEQLKRTVEADATLKDLYDVGNSESGNTSCTIQGPPPPQGSLLQPNRVSGIERVMSDDALVPAVSDKASPLLTMLHLNSVKTKSGKKIKIIESVAPHWRDVASLLNFDQVGTTMKRIEQMYRDPVECCREVMAVWLSGKGEQPATKDLLERILRECDLVVLADDVKEAIIP